MIVKKTAVKPVPKAQSKIIKLQKVKTKVVPKKDAAKKSLIAKLPVKAVVTIHPKKVQIKKIAEPVAPP